MSLDQLPKGYYTFSNNSELVYNFFFFSSSNPQVQAEALEYGALELLCRFITLQEPELVQRRGLFALSALLRGKTQAQLVFMQQCQGLWQLGHNFDQRTMPTQLKSVTLLTDLLHEQVRCYLLT